MRFRLFCSFLAVNICGIASAHAAESRYLAQGYWSWTQNPTASSDRYIRITGDSGYYCFLDGKSGFAFAIVQDSITTPMNGMNAIQWMPNSGSIVLTGSEKGVSYYDRFDPLFDSTAYWGACGSQDKNKNTVGVGKSSWRRPRYGRAGGNGIFPWQREDRSLTGRKSGAPAGQAPAAHNP